MIEGKPDDAAMEWAENELEKDALREQISRLIAERDGLEAAVLQVCGTGEQAVCIFEIAAKVAAAIEANAKEVKCEPAPV